jgi:long-chain acyl-CoA synthetase
VAGVGSALPRHLQPLYALKQRREGAHAVRPGGIVHRFEDLAASSPLTVPPTADPDDVAVLQYTGGTTGIAKGAMLTHRNLIANALQAREWQSHVTAANRIDDPVVLCAAPFFHVYGLTIGMNLAIVSGATMVLVPRFVPRDVARAAEKHHPQFFPGVPTMYTALADAGAGRRQFGSIKICISGAAPLPGEVQDRFETVSGAQVVEGYGLTEAGPVTHCNPLGGGRRPGTVGVPFPDTDAMVTDPSTWEALPEGAVGELTVRGPQVMTGYWNRPEETAAVLRDGWLHTGDMAVMDEDGFFRIVERKKDVILASGFNVYPREVEEILYRHPSVKEAAVVGVPNAYRGETVKAVVVLHEGAPATEEELIAFCRRELAAFKAPTRVEFVDCLPRSPVGKVLRRSLRDEGPGSSEQSA